MRKLLKNMAVFLMNALTAAIGTDWFSYTVRPFFHRPQDFAASMRSEDYISAAVATLLGFVVFSIWKSRSAKWVWVAGLCFFGWRATELWIGPSILAPRTLFWEFTRAAAWDPLEIAKNFPFSLVLIRTVFYSAGAAVCSGIALARDRASFVAG